MDQVINNQLEALEAIQRTNKQTDIFLKNIQDLIKNNKE